MRVLTFTTLYPNAQRPSHGIFVENRITHLAASGGATIQVVAPIPYVPDLGIIPPTYRVLAQVPRREVRRGLDVHHPRYLLLPKVSMLVAPFSLYLAARSCLAAIKQSGYQFDLIDAHYFYPDGVAAVLLGRDFDKPVTITARGSDINLIPQHSLPRQMIQWAAGQAAGLITVSGALKDALINLGASADKIRVLRNGVDLESFRPIEREQARLRLGFTCTTLITVGNLVPLKNHDLVIRSLIGMPEVQLGIVGDGPEESNLRRLASDLGVSHRVKFFGRLPHTSLPEIYGAADFLILPSSREGWANVLLECMACGTPVIGSNVGGTPEVVATPRVGALLENLTPEAITQVVRRLLAQRLDRHAVRSYAEGFSWDDTTRGQLELFATILNGHPS
jgi:glycosyltransferase involved in cell wall biosynthesis